MDFKFKYHKACKTCKYCRRHPALKDEIINLRMFNPQSDVSLRDLIKKHPEAGLTLTALSNHCKSHITPMEKRLVNILLNEKTNITAGGVAELVPMVAAREGIGEHEQTLDEFISEFHLMIRNKQLKMTVKDGLAAIKIKADMVKSDKDRKKDILGMMLGANEQGRPTERAEAS